MSGLAFDLSQLPAGWRPIPERVPSSLTDSDYSTKQTVELMVRHIHEAAADPHIRAIAGRTSGKWGLGSAENRICWDVFWFCKHAVRFTIDEQAVAALLGEVDQVDFLISPPVLMRMPRPAGDCDDFTMLACALLECNGVPWEIVTVATEAADPGRWSHVYLRAVLPDGRRLALDPTNGTYPGWEVPAYDVQRKQYWDMEGNPVNGPASTRRDLRMHAYVPRRRRGMGQDGSGEVSVEGSALPTDIAGTPSVVDTSNPFANPTQAQWYATYGTAAPAAATTSSSFNLNSLLAALANTGTTLGKMALLPSGDSLLANGSVISTSGAASGLLSSGTTVGGISITTILMIAALGLGVMMVANHK